jgi:hypothetical protein
MRTNMATKAKKKPGKRGSIGTDTFEQIEKLMAAEKIGRTEAFKRLSQKTGRRAGTVAANYYRVARKRGATLAPRRRRGLGGAAAQGSLQRAAAALNDVGALVRKLEAEIVRLRKENHRFTAIRRLMSR